MKLHLRLLVLTWAGIAWLAAESVAQETTGQANKNNVGQRQKPFIQMLPVQSAASPVLPENARVIRDLEYVPGGHERQKLDLYLPQGDGKMPLIIWIHGGAWRVGNKNPCPALPLASHGFAIASINYRLSYQAVFPAQIEDCKAAVRWLRANAEKYNLDPDRFGAWGSSAGGFLAALLGASGDISEFDRGGHLDVPSRVQAVCEFYAATDFLQMNKFKTVLDHDSPNSPESQLIGGPIQENKEKAAKANPITYVTKDAPPFFIAHGDKDDIIPLNQSELLRDALKKASVEVEFHIIPGAKHEYVSPELTDKVRDFFVKHLLNRP